MTDPTRDTAQEFLHQARIFLAEDYLPKIERCLEKLSDEQIWWRANEESNSIGNLILHLCGNARQWIVAGLGAGSDHRDRDSEFAQRETIPRAELTKLLVETLKDVDGVLEEFRPERLLRTYKIQGKDVVALEAIFHVVEHFSMHTGQIIMITKMLNAKDLNFYDFSTGVPVHTWNR
jgi:uncharacterized damage-inducible protein DinB